MTREDMIRMALEAGWKYAYDGRGFEPLWRFATLVAAAEREACAKVADYMAGRCLHPDEIADAIRARGENT